MRCYRYQKFGYTPQRWATHLACGQCGEGGHGEEPCSKPPRCVNCSGPHASADRSAPSSSRRRLLSNFGTRTVKPFRIGTQTFATAVRRPRGIAATQTTAVVDSGVVSVAPCQSEVSIQTEDLSIFILPGVRLRVCQPPFTVAGHCSARAPAYAPLHPVLHLPATGSTATSIRPGKITVTVTTTGYSSWGF
jgi:hypothetical protein